MNRRASQVAALDISISLYRLLIQAYPREFREQYGAHMLQVFRDRCRERLSARGSSGLVLWWAVTVIDFIGSVIQQHLRKESYMTVPGYIRASAWALIAGAIAHLTHYIAGMLLIAENSVIYWEMQLGFHLLSTLLLSVGALGVREHLGAKVGPPGKNVLAFGIGASLLGYTALTDWVWELEPPLGMLPFWGSALLLASLAIFGRMAANAGVLPQSLGWLMLASLWLLIGLSVEYIAGYPLWETRPTALIAFGWAGCILTTLALVRLGLLLQSGPDREPAPA